MTCYKSIPAISVLVDLFFANLFWRRYRTYILFCLDDMSLLCFFKGRTKQPICVISKKTSQVFCPASYTQSVRNILSGTMGVLYCQEEDKHQRLCHSDASGLQHTALHYMIKAIHRVILWATYLPLKTEQQYEINVTVHKFWQRIWHNTQFRKINDYT